MFVLRGGKCCRGGIIKNRGGFKVSDRVLKEGKMQWEKSRVACCGEMMSAIDRP